jgi:hypothetical protein
MYILLATRHLLPLTRDVDWTAAQHTMVPPCGQSVALPNVAASLRNIPVYDTAVCCINYCLRWVPDLQIGGYPLSECEGANTKRGWGITFVEETIKEYKILAGKPERRRPLGGHGRIGWDNIKTNVGKGLPLEKSKKNLYFSLPLKVELIRWPETSVKDYYSTLRNIPEERRSQVSCQCNATGKLTYH